MKDGIAVLPYLYAENLQTDILKVYVYMYIHMLRKSCLLLSFKSFLEVSVDSKWPTFKASVTFLHLMFQLLYSVLGVFCLNESWF